MNRKIKTKKIPILSYLCYLLVVSVLFTGVTFSRYTTATSGDLGAGVSPFVASYEILDMSSNTYTNANFWIEANNSQQGVARTLRFNLSNSRPANDSPTAATIVSDVDLSAKIRFYVPAEFADELVLQIAQEKDNTTTPVMPQIVLGNLIYNVSLTEQQHGTYYTYPNGSKTYASYTNGTLETQYFRDYASRGGTDTTLTMNGSLENVGGYMRAEGDFGTISITRAQELRSYSVGFQREKYNDASVIYSQLFLDLEKTMDFYTVEIELNNGLFDFNGGIQTDKTFVLFLSLAERITSDDYGYYWEESQNNNDVASRNYQDGSLDYILKEPTVGEAVRTFNGAVVTGYHFDFNAPIHKLSDNGYVADNSTTQIRVKKEYVRNTSDGTGGTYSGESVLSFYHVAPISETAVNYVHPIVEFYESTVDGVPTLRPETISQAQGLFGLCSLFAEDESPEYYISFDGVPDNPFHDSYHGDDSVDQDIAISVSLSKSYYTQLNVVFTQTSDVRSRSAEGGGV